MTFFSKLAFSIMLAAFFAIIVGTCDLIFNGGAMMSSVGFSNQAHLLNALVILLVVALTSMMVTLWVLARQLREKYPCSHEEHEQVLMQRWKQE